MENSIIKTLAMATTEKEKLNPYYHDASGALWYANDGKEKLVSEVYIKVTGFSRGIDGTCWSAVVKFKDLDNKPKGIQIPCKTLLDPKETFRLLVDSGFKASCCRAPLIKYLQDAQPEKRLIQLTGSGWVADRLEYVCPSFKVADGAEKYVLSSCDSAGLSESGTLEEWQEQVCQYCVGNPILTTALCIGLSGTLLRFLPSMKSTMVNLVGKSSIGKTTALQAAASLWGSSKAIKQWRCTSNALEGIAEGHNDGLLILDELGQVNGKDVSNIAYMLGNEEGKSRMNADSTLRNAKRWRLSILSSGEIGIADKMEEAGMKAKGGQLVRCIDIDACVSEFGIYNCLHGAKDGAELSNTLKENCSKYYGTAAEEFIRSLVEDISYENLKDSVNDEFSNEHERIVTKFKLEKADGQVDRVARVFALYTVSGVYASRLNVFTHTEEQVREDLHKIFERWLKDRGGKGAFEEQNIVEALGNFLLQNEHRFKELNSRDEKPVVNCIGYKTMLSDRQIYYICPGTFRKEFSANYIGINHKTVRNFLIDHEIIVDLSENGRDKPLCLSNGIRQRMTKIDITKVTAHNV